MTSKNCRIRRNQPNHRECASLAHSLKRHAACSKHSPGVEVLAGAGAGTWIPGRNGVFRAALPAAAVLGRARVERVMQVRVNGRVDAVKRLRCVRRA